MFERFTDRARRVVVLAQEEARMLHHDFIGTEHLLLTLVREGEADGEGAGAQVLARLGTDLNRVRAEVIQLLPGGQDDRKRRALPDVLSRLDLLESRLTALDAEVERLRRLLRQHGSGVDDGPA